MVSFSPWFRVWRLILKLLPASWSSSWESDINSDTVWHVSTLISNILWQMIRNIKLKIISLMATCLFLVLTTDWLPVWRCQNVWNSFSLTTYLHLNFLRYSLGGVAYCRKVVTILVLYSYNYGLFSPGAKHLMEVLHDNEMCLYLIIRSNNSHASPPPHLYLDTGE